jgi:hypothetical protein
VARQISAIKSLNTKLASSDVANREQGSISLRELCLRHLVSPALTTGRE